MHGVISLPDATSYDKFEYSIVKVCLAVITLNLQYIPLYPHLQQDFNQFSCDLTRPTWQEIALWQILNGLDQ